MTWKSTMRTGLAIARRIERDNNRRSKEVARQYRQLQKQEVIRNAAIAVREYEDYISLITSLHKDSSDVINWSDIYLDEKPKEPILSNKNEKDAENNLKNYTPNFWDNLFGGKKRKLQNLQFAHTAAKNKDKIDFEKAQKKYIEELEEWKTFQGFADGIKQKDIEVYKSILEYFNPFADIKEIGSGLKTLIKENCIEIELEVNGSSIIPDFVLTQTSTGKLSNKKMAISRFNELYQDYVCGSVLRIGREIFSIIPVDIVVVTAVSEMLNTSNGMLENTPILSVVIRKDTLEKLNLLYVDPSDSMKNFIHNMKFSKTNAFSEVKAISLSQIDIN